MKEKRVLRIHRSESKFYRPIGDICSDIIYKGYSVTKDPECNPVTYWIYTDMPIDDIRRIDGVFDAI